jgi:hypothetical protein
VQKQAKLEGAKTHKIPANLGRFGYSDDRAMLRKDAA